MGRSETSGRDESPPAPLDVSIEIPDKTYFKIGEAAKLVGVKPYIIRYWESEFRALRPAKTKSRQRLFRRKDIELLLLIKQLLYDQKFTIEGARLQLKDLTKSGLAYREILDGLESDGLAGLAAQLAGPDDEDEIPEGEHPEDTARAAALQEAEATVEQLQAKLAEERAARKAAEDRAASAEAAFEALRRGARVRWQALLDTING